MPSPTPETTEDIAVCTNCESAYRGQRAGTACNNCGAPVESMPCPVDLSREPEYIGMMAFLKPLADAVTESFEDGNLLREAGGPSLDERFTGQTVCGWCGRQYDSRPSSPNCTECGGVLPMPPDGDAGPPPPAPPRRLPRKFYYQLYVKQNVGGIVGLVCLLISLPLMLAPLFGIPLFLIGLVIAYSNFATARRRRIALSNGVPVLGRIESVKRIGGKNTNHGSVMHQVFFRFDLPGRPLLGMKHTYDPAITEHFIGQPVWVVYVRRSPKHYALWPPLA
jgi:hypothetical protein